MVFRTDKQRKAFFARKGNSRSSTKPNIIGKIKGVSKILIKKKERLAKALRERREKKGKARIAQEKLALQREKIQAKRLRQELEVEQAREAVAQHRRETQAEFRRIKREEFERRIAPVRAGVARAIKVGKVVAKVTEKATRPKRRKKAEPGFFGI